MKSILLVSLTSFLFLAITGCEQSQSVNSQQAENAAQLEAASQADLITRCVNSAIANAYVDGQCSYMFIDACVTTQSKQEMEKWLRMDSSKNRVRMKGCTGMPATYVDAFNREFSKHDRF